jgi:hypothetical protein
MAVSFQDRVKVSPDVLFRLVGDEAVLLNLTTERYFGLNPIGTRIWNVLSTSESIQTAYETLLREYDVDPARLRADLEELVGDLLAQKLIEAGS